MEKLRFSQYSASSDATKRQRDFATSDEPLQHSMKRLRVDVPSPAYDNQYAYHSQYVHQERSHQAPNSHSCTHYDKVTTQDLSLYNTYYQQQQQQQQQQQDVQQVTSPKCSFQTYIPMNQLLGNLHQERQLQQQRHEQSRKATQLPSNSQLF